MKLADVLDLLAPLNGKYVGGELAKAREISFSGVSLHSKQMVPGSLFVAIPGVKEDGVSYAREAVKNGASAIITQAPIAELSIPQVVVSDARAAAADIAAAWFRYPGRRMSCFGITGTNGKTTTSYMLRSILEAAGHKVGLFGTVGYFLLDRAVPAPNTTPDSISLQSYLAELANSGADSMVMEVSSHALTQSRARGIPFKAGVFTNLSSEHLDYHRTMEEYLHAKAKLFEDLAPESKAVLNLEDMASMQLKSMTRAQIVTYAIDRPEATIRAEIQESTMNGVRFNLITPQGKTEVRLALPGRHNVMNFLAAIGAAQSIDISLEAIAKGAERLKSVPGRLERVDETKPFAVFVDYAHTDDAIEKVLKNLRPLTRGKLIIVFGCGGDRDRTKRPRMGRVGTELADYAIITSDNPRTEDPVSIIGEILSGIRAQASRYQVEPDRRKAIRKAVEMAKPGDVVLIAGKGHENYQIIGKSSYPFDDREVVREALNGTV